jgi:dethiobiotin synthetase
VRGLFVTATDTGVGKTVLSAALLAAMAAAGERVRAHKPAVTGLEDEVEIAARGEWPPDHELLAAAAGMSAEAVSPLRFGPAVSPHLAAQLAGQPIDPERVVAAARVGVMDETVAVDETVVASETVIVEGVGGLLVPLTEDYTVCDLAAALALPVVIAARPGLGTINHTLLTLRVARAAGLDVRAVVLTPWPQESSPMERSNRETIERMGAVDVHTLAHVGGPDLGELAQAGGELPWQRWLGSGCVRFVDAARTRIGIDGVYGQTSVERTSGSAA